MKAIQILFLSIFTIGCIHDNKKVIKSPFEKINKDVYLNSSIKDKYLTYENSNSIIRIDFNIFMNDMNKIMRHNRNIDNIELYDYIKSKIKSTNELYFNENNFIKSDKYKDIEYKMNNASNMTIYHEYEKLLEQELVILTNNYFRSNGYSHYLNRIIQRHVADYLMDGNAQVYNKIKRNYETLIYIRSFGMVYDSEMGSGGRHYYFTNMIEFLSIIDWMM